MTKVFSISNIPEFSKKERIVVVGVIGKSPYRYPNKTSPLLSGVQSEENDIECHWDERKGILYLHAVTYLDTKRLVSLATSLDEDSKSTVKDADAAHWLVAAGELAIESCRAIALIFHLCHIVVLSSPTHMFDLNYLQLFRAVDGYRAELTAATTEALLRAAAGGAWDTHGRPCCPRLLFHFRRAPSQLRRAPALLKKLEHAVEDQIYFILRKARIITNVCAKSLFAIPKNEEFVYMSSSEECGDARDVSALLRGLVRLCAGAEPGPQPQRSFRQFLQSHLDMALGDGFDDNVGKYAMSTSFFEVLPIAQASYAEGLPPHYSSQHHLHKVGVALGVVDSMARGPLAAAARARLTAACAATWRTRTLCEAPSLTGHPCVLPHHDSSVEHSSGVRYVSACNCGRTKCSREDPYSVRAANHSFYTLAADECGTCKTLQAVHFPVFQPSTPSFRAAAVKGAEGSAARADGKEAEDEGAPPSPASPRSCWSPPDELSPGSADDDEDAPAPCGDADLELLAVHEPSAPEKSISRQPSTTEYLPGMLHTGSPAGLLPAFPSWSLVCLGASSLYSHSAGLPEHLQAGFLPHANHLLPWDCALAGRARGRHAPTVKIFFGYEYECGRGHRFVPAAPENGAGARFAAADVPLAAPCVCRAPGPARLARLHVVTPKAAVAVTLTPRVQPAPGRPAFTPGAGEPLRLSASAYWVLRFPFVYADERGVVPRSRALAGGCVLAPMFGLQAE
ncbi:nonsense-mediated mRNA decay factor SMG8 isoform X2 [Bicyclus anynana]|uniref:Nonsense-mediated mRNA decay factor SMG8 n=1 Tax=Bicyclus anynana TaxID=110368 RepID=A0A6J1MPN1_BICAN|nr:nonsense-mediated mRNA decay factor SMG8 isoform X2 [Bicyclus anynana]